jgi:hypothetical protein
MMNPKLFSVIRVSLLGFIAMNCISCAHQAKEVALVIDTDTPVVEQVDQKSENELMASAEKTEETQPQSEVVKLQVVESEAQAEPETQVLFNVASNDGNPISENKVEAELENSNPQVAKLEKDSESASLSNSQPPVAPEEMNPPSRSVASEPSKEEITTPSQVEPTVGVPAKIKYDEKVPSRKREKTSQAELVKPETNMAVAPKEEPQTNALGEEEDSTPQLASVEIATFVENHWLAVLIGAVVTVAGLFFVVRRKQDDDSQPI